MSPRVADPSDTNAALSVVHLDDIDALIVVSTTPDGFAEQVSATYDTEHQAQCKLWFMTKRSSQ